MISWVICYKALFGSFVLSPCETPKARQVSTPLPSSHPLINSPLKSGNLKVEPSPAPKVVPIALNNSA